MKNKSKKEWIEFGQGLGRFRDSKQIRSISNLNDFKSSFIEDVNNYLKINRNDSELIAYQNHWYGIKALQSVLLEYQKTLENDLFNAGVLTPELFDWAKFKKEI